MTTLVAGAAFDMQDFVANGSLSDFFEFGEVVTATATEFVVVYSDGSTTERLTLTGTFAGYADGYPTTGTIESLAFAVDGVTIFTLSNVAISVEQFTAFAQSDDLAGLFQQLLAGADELTGSAGNDVLLAFAGNDILSGGGGSDIFHGGAGDDQYLVEGVATEINGGYAFSGVDQAIELADAGSDTVTANVSYTLGANVENLNLLGGLNLVGFGNALDNVIVGNSGNNFLRGEGGDDYLDGGEGADHLVGGSGSDTYVVDNEGDLLDVETPGLAGDVDTVMSSISFALDFGFENLTLIGTAAIDGTGTHLDNELRGNTAANQLSGGGGNDVLAGGLGSDTLTGGFGADTFVGTAAELSGDTITDFRPGDSIVISDADLASFDFSRSGTTLTYSGGSLELQGPAGRLVASAAAGGGVQLALESPTMARLVLTEPGQDFLVGGNVMIFGTAAGGEEIEVIRGSIMLDASFNAGGDMVVLPGAAGTYSASLTGSFVTLAGGDISIAIPVGIAGLTVAFGDAERTLRYDPDSGQVLLGDQAIGSTAEAVEPSGEPLNVAEEPIWEGMPTSLAQLILTAPGQDVDIGGNVAIFGTAAGGEVISVLGGTTQLDASFNLGGDTVVLPGASGNYSASLSGSFVTLTDGNGIDVAIPVGTAGLTVEFGDASAVLRYDVESGEVRLGDYVVTQAGSVAAQPASSPLFAAALDLAVDGLGVELSGPDHAYLVPDHSARMEFQRLEMIDSFQFG